MILFLSNFSGFTIRPNDYECDTTFHSQRERYMTARSNSLIMLNIFHVFIYPLDFFGEMIPLHIIGMHLKRLTIPIFGKEISFTNRGNEKWYKHFGKQYVSIKC